MPQKRDGAPVCHDDGRVERLELLLHERNRQRLSQQVDLERFVGQPVSCGRKYAARRRSRGILRCRPTPHTRSRRA